MSRNHLLTPSSISRHLSHISHPNSFSRRKSANARIIPTQTFKQARVMDDSSVNRAEEYQQHARRGHNARGGRSRGGRGGRGGDRGGGPMNREVAISKALSKLLRHAAEEAELKLDAEGYAPLDKVVSIISHFQDFLLPQTPSRAQMKTFHSEARDDRLWHHSMTVADE